MRRLQTSETYNLGPFLVFKWHLKWYLKLIPKNNSILASKNGILDVLGDLLGGPGALKSKFRRVLFERPIWLPVQTPPFSPQPASKVSPKGGFLASLGPFMCTKIGQKMRSGDPMPRKDGFQLFRCHLSPRPAGPPLRMCVVPFVCFTLRVR